MIRRYNLRGADFDRHPGDISEAFGPGRSHAVAEVVCIALRALARHKLRSALTVLGISIGVGAFICSVAVGEGASRQIQEQIRSVGGNMIWIEAGGRNVNGVRTGSHGTRSLTQGDARAIQEQVALVANVSPNTSTGTLLVSAFINPTLNGFGANQTGIAYDGNHYFVSDIFANKLLEYDGLGNFIRVIDLSGIPNPFTGRELEVLSAVGNTVGNPPPDLGAVPEPGTLLLLGTSLAGVVGAAWRRRTNQ